MIRINYKKLVPEAKEPFKKFGIDAGFDLFCTSIKETSEYIQYNTGIAFEIPEGYVGLVFPRSSVTKYDLMLKNSVGVIDATYRGEIMCRFTPIVNGNLKDILIDRESGAYTFQWDKDNQYKVGDRIAQIVFVEIPKVALLETKELSSTERGKGGFGHTGK